MTWGGLAVGAAMMWAAVVGYAYARQPFEGSARNYILAWLGLWVLTMGMLTLMAIVEAS
jgi:hypothetical protein